MTISDLGSLGEFVGGLLVVVSLFYLASQIRNNTRSLRATAFRDTVSAVNAWATLLVQDPSLGPILERGFRDLGTLDESERSQFDSLMHIVIREYASAVTLEREGFLIEGDVSSAFEIYLREAFASPAMVEWWGENKHQVAPSSHERISKLLAA